MVYMPCILFLCNGMYALHLLVMFMAYVHCVYAA
jgi:hypothetical protein